MSKRVINLILFAVFIIEGSVFRYISPDYFGSNSSIFARFVLVLIMLISIYIDRKYALFLGLAFGLLYDIVYGNVLGLYMVGMGGIGYLSGWFIQFLHPTFLVYLLIEFLGLLIFEIFIYSMLSLYKLIEFNFDWAMINIIFPTIIFNLVFAILIYFPAKHLLRNRDIGD